MESPFFRNHWNYHPQRPRYVPSMMEVPVQRRMSTMAPKVVSIPVRFAESEKSRCDSAVKIQKVFRGFLVRRSVMKIVAIEGEVNEIERRLADEETVKLIRRDAKERVRFGEMLMSLLFKLDSVKGVDSGIRNLRKAVIKKAIALQEKIDSIVAADEATDETLEVGNGSGAGESGVEETPELWDRISEHKDESTAADIANTEPADDCDGDVRAIETFDGCNDLENADGVASRPLSIENEGTIIEESVPCPSESNVVAEVPDADDDLLKPQVPDHGVNSPNKISGKDESAEMVSELKVLEEDGDKDMVHRGTEAAEAYAAMSEAESQTDSSNSPPNSEKGIAEYAAVDEREGSGNEEDHVKEEEEEDSRVKGREEDGQSRELLKRVIMDNKKMMEMMAQLFERNEMQTRLLCSLSHRVEQLEKAFVYQTLRRTKKRNSSIVDGSEKCPKTKK